MTLPLRRASTYLRSFTTPCTCIRGDLGFGSILSRRDWSLIQTHERTTVEGTMSGHAMHDGLGILAGDPIRGRRVNRAPLSCITDQHLLGGRSAELAI